MSTAVGSCGYLVFVVPLLLLLLLSENCGVQSKAIGISDGNVTSTTEESILATTTTTTDGVPIFDRQHVALAVSDDLYSSTANLTLRLRDIIGQLVLVRVQGHWKGIFCSYSIEELEVKASDYLVIDQKLNTQCTEGWLTFVRQNQNKTKPCTLK